MKVHILASGSKGNVLYIETENHKILFDLGTNIKYINEKLTEINRDLNDIDHVFFSHTHSDHIAALKPIIKKYKPTVCMSEVMFYDLKSIQGYDKIKIYDNRIYLDEIKIDTIKTSHDAKDSRGFIISVNGESLVYLTDTGYINQKLYPKLENHNYYLLESNHDIEKLMNGRYPSWLKKRVYSDTGHLSNKDAAIHLSRLIGPKTKKIFLMHLSEENNTEDLALSTIKAVFEEYGIEFENIYCGKQRERIEVIS